MGFGRGSAVSVAENGDMSSPAVPGPSLHLVAADDPGEIRSALNQIESDHLVLLVPAGPVVVIDADELVLSFVHLEMDLVVAAADRLAAIGGVEALARLLDGELVDAEIDEDHEMIHVVSDDQLLALDDGWAYLPTGARPLVVAGEPAEPSYAAEVRTFLQPFDERPATGPVEVAPEIVEVGFWTPAKCAEVIELAEAHGGWGRDPDDPVPGDEISLAAISPFLLTHLEDEVTAWVEPVLRQHWPYFAWCGVHDAFVIRYGAGTEGPSTELRLHHDVAQISLSVRLNDGFVGGALEFPRQDYDTTALGVGHLVAWPSLVTHPHRGHPVTQGTKYGLTIWLRLPDT